MKHLLLLLFTLSGGILIQAQSSNFEFSQQNNIVDSYFEKQVNEEVYLLDLVNTYKWENDIGDWSTNIDTYFQYYYSQGKLVEKYYLHNSEAYFAYNKKYSYSYNDQGLTNEILIEEWDVSLSTYGNEKKLVLTYNDLDLLIDVDYYDWNLDSLSWDIHLQDLGFYNDDNLLSERFINLWSPDAEMWIPSLHKVYSYDEDNNKINYTVYSWDEEMEDWIYSSKHDFTYDDTSFLLYRISSSWDFDTENWRNTSKTDYSYDANGNRAQYIYQSWDQETESWKNSRKYIFHWSLYFLENPQYIDEDALFYPNPVSKLLQFENNNSTILQVQIYNDLGQLVFKTEGVVRSIDVSTLQSGVYYVKMSNTDNEMINQQKIIVK